MQHPEHAFRRGIRKAARKALGLDVTTIPLSYPPSPDLGDVASPVCFELARTARRAPRELARAIADAFEAESDIERVEVAGGGYLNAFFDRTALLKRWLAEGTPPSTDSGQGKVIVEHTNINPNKAAHIGHLRNAVLGDTLVRCLRRLGRTVEVQNYIDDTGVQLADLVVGFLVLRGERPDEVAERYSESRLAERGERFDYVAWDLYAEVTRYYEQDPSRLSHREETLKAIEDGDNPVAALAATVARRMVLHHLTTMDRIGVRYDLLPRESDILSLHFWARAFEMLKESAAIKQSTEGKHAGCWVMDLHGAEEGAGEDQKVIVRSNGSVTYVGKDIAYQLWKFGLLGPDFCYAPLDWSPRDALYHVWATRSHDDTPGRPAFGRGAVVYNVIDSRQSFLQRVVNQGLRSLGHDDEADRSIHYGYEMVALTPAAVATLFPHQPLNDEDRAKPYLEMSGRRGLGVKADDLLDSLLERSSVEVQRRNPEMTAERVDESARRIAVGALRYYMLRFTRNRIVAFDLDAALAFEGETGPYLQYSAVRARNILAKLEAQEGAGSVDRTALAEQVDLDSVSAATRGEHWNLALGIHRVDAVVHQAVETLELATLAKQAYLLAQAFNTFYHRYPVSQETDPALRATRIGLVRLYHDGLIELLDLMGIDVPDRM